MVNEYEKINKEIEKWGKLIFERTYYLEDKSLTPEEAYFEGLADGIIAFSLAIYEDMGEVGEFDIHNYESCINLVKAFSAFFEDKRTELTHRNPRGLTPEEKAEILRESIQSGNLKTYIYSPPSPTSGYEENFDL